MVLADTTKNPSLLRRYKHGMPEGLQPGPQPRDTGGLQQNPPANQNPQPKVWYFYKDERRNRESAGIEAEIIGIMAGIVITQCRK
jgi:hypothetical protein